MFLCRNVPWNVPTKMLLELLPLIGFLHIDRRDDVTDTCNLINPGKYDRQDQFIDRGLVLGNEI
jgi:hypothetical protein